jgi:hypothetical protein
MVSSTKPDATAAALCLRARNALASGDLPGAIRELGQAAALDLRESARQATLANADAAYEDNGSLRAFESALTEASGCGAPDLRGIRVEAANSVGHERHSGTQRRETATVVGNKRTQSLDSSG